MRKPNLSRSHSGIGRARGVAAIAAIVATTACSSTGTAAGEGVDAGPTVGGLPCDVVEALSLCLTCHGTVRRAGAPMSLTSHADLVARSRVDSKQSIAERAVARMRDASNPMPPPPSALATASSIAALQKWIAAGSPMANCDRDAGPDPFAVPPACPSGDRTTYATVDLTDEQRRDMYPGGACIACHAAGPGPRDFAFGGTVFTSPHALDDCREPPTFTATVVVTDANGTVFRADVRPAGGNFYYRDPGRTFKPPYNAKVVRSDGTTRQMLETQTDGDCNGCHTQAGTKTAPGRILMP